jgi:hypothetical protein
LLHIDPNSNAKNERNLAWRGFVFFCVLLLIAAATVQTAHTHPVLVKTSDRCQICLALHSTAFTASAETQVVLLAAADPVSILSEATVLSFWHFSLSNRPPPFDQI